MTADVHSHGKACDVRGIGFHMHRQGRGFAAQPAGTAEAPAEGFSPEPAAEEAKEEEFSWNGSGKEEEE